MSWQYPFVEIGTGLLFLLVAYRAFVSTETAISLALYFVFFAIAASLLMVITVYDIQHKIIPDPFVFWLIGLSILSLFFNSSGVSWSPPTVWHLLAGPILAAPLAFLWLVSKGSWMGLGDAKLVLAFGWFLGLRGGFSGLVMGFWIGAVYAVLVLLFQRISKMGLSFGSRTLTMKSEVPFAPFLILGFGIAWYFGFDVLSLPLGF